MIFILISIGLAFVLDLLLGDPHGIPHPVTLIGKCVAFWEEKLLRQDDSPSVQRRKGTVLVILVLLICVSIPAIVLYVVYRMSPPAAFLLHTFFCYQILAAKSLKTESMKVYEALVGHSLVRARTALSWIVGRDTAQLTEEEVVKATVETIAENTSDGVVAPLLCMCLGGAPLAFLYKTVNTMDSMIGYRTSKYLHFGMPAARLDDVLNLIPARISGFLLIYAAYLLRLDWKKAWTIFRRDRYHHLSPNSAMTESAVAGALGIQLGGSHHYFGELIEKQTIGDADRPARPEDIKKANELMYAASFSALLLFLVMSYYFFVYK